MRCWRTIFDAINNILCEIAFLLFCYHFCLILVAVVSALLCSLCYKKKCYDFSLELCLLSNIFDLANGKFIGKVQIVFDRILVFTIFRLFILLVLLERMWLSIRLLYGWKTCEFGQFWWKSRMQTSVGLHYNLWIERYVLVGINDSNRNGEFFVFSTSNGSIFNRKIPSWKPFTLLRAIALQHAQFHKEFTTFFTVLLHS